MAKKKMQEWVYWTLSEAAFYGFFVYLLVLLKVTASVWMGALLLWALMNAAILSCPLLRKCSAK